MGSPSILSVSTGHSCSVSPHPPSCDPERIPQGTGHPCASNGSFRPLDPSPASCQFCGARRHPLRPPSEAAGNTGAWLREAPGSPCHGSRHSAIGLRAQMRTACVAGPAGLQQGWGRPSLPDPWGARQPEGAVDREQELSWPQSFLPAATQGRALGSGGGLSWGGDGSAWGSAWTRTLARPAGVSPALRTESHPGRAESESLGQRRATVSCRHSQAGGQEETRSGPWKPATGKEGKEPKAGGVSPPC